MSNPTPIHHYLDGKITPGSSGRTGAVFNPATGVHTGAVDLASAAEVDSAVAAAAVAFPAWRATPLARRTDILFRFRALLDEHRVQLARIITAEHGKVHSDALGEVSRGIENAEFACGIPAALKGDHNEQIATGVDVYSIRQPVGVMAGITPFNFPVMVPMWMLTTAIACGNTFILKPSEKDPSASLLLAELFDRAGLPPGVLNVVQGDREAVDRLIEHPDVRAISFVGSTPVARSIYERATAQGKRVQALGGAKNHMVVLPDADIDAAADAAVSAAYGSAGERCMAISVLVAVGDIADPLVEAIKVRIPDVVVAPGDQADAEMGPLITAEHRDNVAAHIGRAVDDGAVVVVDGRELQRNDDGFWLGPTLIDDVSEEMDIHRQEVFGPVLAVMRVDSYDDAVGLVNRHAFGNGTAIFTRDGGAARRYQFDVEVGMVGINVPIPVPVSYHSFGGWKASLFGDTHIYGPDGVRFCTRTKVVTSRWPDPSTSSIDLGFPSNR